jgi:hypothetical protein
MNTGTKRALVIGLFTALGGIWSMEWNPLAGSLIGCLWAMPIPVGIGCALLAKLDHELIAVKWLKVVET